MTQPQGTLGAKKGHVADSMDPQTLKQKLAEMENKNQGAAQKMSSLLEEAEDKADRELLGLDVEFDIDSIIKLGAVEKKGLTIPGIPEFPIFDMHTITNSEDSLAERITQAELGSSLKVDKEYYEVKEAAMLAMAITRLNSGHFPSPRPEMPKDVFDFAYEKKVLLFKALRKMQKGITSTLSLMYSNLALADVLTVEAKKKFEELLDPETSGQSAPSSTSSPTTPDSSPSQESK